MRFLSCIPLIFLIGCSITPSSLDVYEVGTVTCYNVRTSSVIGKWENAHAIYRSYDGIDHVNVYLTKTVMDQGIPRIMRSDHPVGDWKVTEGVCVTLPTLLQEKVNK